MVKNEIIVLSEASSFEEFYYSKYFSCEILVFFKLITSYIISRVEGKRYYYTSIFFPQISEFAYFSP